MIIFLNALPSHGIEKFHKKANSYNMIDENFNEFTMN